MQQIPKVDLNDFLSTDPDNKKQFVSHLGSAFEEIGFVALKGHFLSPEFMGDLYTEIKAFFDFSLEVKKQYEVEGGGGQRGYTSLARNMLKTRE